MNINFPDREPSHPRGFFIKTMLHQSSIVKSIFIEEINTSYPELSGFQENPANLIEMQDPKVWFKVMRLRQEEDEDYFSNLSQISSFWRIFNMKVSIQNTGVNIFMSMFPVLNLILLVGIFTCGSLALWDGQWHWKLFKLDISKLSTVKYLGYHSPGDTHSALLTQSQYFIFKIPQCHILLHYIIPRWSELMLGWRGETGMWDTALTLFVLSPRLINLFQQSFHKKYCCAPGSRCS